jgi:hypothetical protein
MTDYDRKMIELAATAAGYEIARWTDNGDALLLVGVQKPWNPLGDDGDRYRLAKKLGLCVDFTECTVWKSMPDHSLIQEYWDGDCGDEASAIVRAAAEIGRAAIAKKELK